MPIVVVTSNAPGEGKTGVAAAIARHYAYLGRATRLARIAGSEPSPGAAHDAALFASFAFGPGSFCQHRLRLVITDPGDDAILVVEADAADAAIAGAKVVLVARGSAATRRRASPPSPPS